MQRVSLLVCVSFFLRLALTTRLQEFKNLNPPVDLVQGAELEMTIRGDTMLFKNAVGGVGTIRSEVFTRAMCDVYYGTEPVSPTHKEAVLEGIPKL
jgi:hypothetical protein